ncbi:MAG: 23S rRNA (adenine(2503)-C(2))-methyltransferase RlmN [Alphaproteobacteria bacterium]|nr:23S rRNA (adenine(2503)-C(2))-methyltransferase RlmN [Alphaproteobacteria bacterium]
MTTTLKNLIGLDRTELAQEMDAVGEKPFRAKQLWHWIYHQGETDFAQMTTLAKPARTKLAEHYTLVRPEVSRELTSSDRSRKWLLKFDDANEAECVFIPEDDRGALCISSQVGCTLNCSFCHTGTQKLVRNLTVREIVSQMMVARDSYTEWPSGREDRLLTNIVMMGMGEPLFNFDNVAKALKIVMDGDGLALSKRRITLSTSGVVPMMERCGEELGVNLAVSLHACNDTLRDELVPINRKYPIRELLAACRAYPGANNARRITFEYAMLKGVNDSDADARQLVRLVHGIPAKFNLIPFNPWPGTIYECSKPSTIRRFAKILNDGGLSAPVRQTRGSDIMAACGQLKSDSQRARRQPSATSGAEAAVSPGA